MKRKRASASANWIEILNKRLCIDVTQVILSYFFEPTTLRWVDDEWSYFSMLQQSWVPWKTAPRIPFKASIRTLCFDAEKRTIYALGFLHLFQHGLDGSVITHPLPQNVLNPQMYCICRKLFFIENERTWNSYFAGDVLNLETLVYTKLDYPLVTSLKSSVSVNDDIYCIGSDVFDEINHSFVLHAPLMTWTKFPPVPGRLCINNVFYMEGKIWCWRHYSARHPRWYEFDLASNEWTVRVLEARKKVQDGSLSAWITWRCYHDLYITTETGTFAVRRHLDRFKCRQVKSIPNGFYSRPLSCRVPWTQFQ